MSGLLRTAVNRAAPALRTHTVSQRASLYTSQPKGKFGALETVVGLSAFGLAILGPAAWILANLESYKKKD